MKKYNGKLKAKVLILFLGIAFITFGFLGDVKDGKQHPKPIYKVSDIKESGKNGDAYAMNINNIYLPLNRKGVIADVNVPPPIGRGSLGQFTGNRFGFLFSSGFFLTGLYNGELFSNAVASASLVEDYVQGTEAGGQNDPNAVLYVLNTNDTPFGQSWQDWKDAVGLGADFYDGDGDGVYNPIDKNGNGQWDNDEDRPDLLGDETVWCVYHDGLPVAQRRWNTTIEVGIEVRQTVFAFASAGAIGNLVFVRYRFKYVGLGLQNEPDQLTDVYFGVWADPDIGDSNDDLVGSDVPRNAGYTYNNGDDPNYGANPPCFMIDFFSGPVVYTPGETFIDNNGNNEYDDGVDTPLDTATSVRGQVKGVVYYPGAKNLPISSFVEYRNGDPVLSDPNNKTEARNYTLGLTSQGNPVDPCTFAYGTQNYPGCDTVDARFWLSGDPVTGIGWINNSEIDQRQMLNTGPFKLNKDEENEIVVAYVVNIGNGPIDAITQARKIDDGAQNIFDFNFLAPSPPPAPRVTLKSGEDFIDITWPTPNQVTYVNQTPTWDLRFEGYQVWAFKSNLNQDEIDGQENARLIASYDLNNFIADIYKENAETGGIELLYSHSTGDNSLNYSVYADEQTGNIRLRLFNDPFNPSGDLVKGTPYYFAVTSYAINYDALVYKSDPDTSVGTVGDYYLTKDAFAQEAENIRTIQTIVMGENLYLPPEPIQDASRISGNSNGKVQVDVTDLSALTGDTYEVSFFKDSSDSKYSMFWKLDNVSTNSVLQDSMMQFVYGSDQISYPSVEGFIVKVSDETPRLGDITFDTGNIWYDTAKTKYYYLATDLEQSKRLQGIGGQLEQLQSDITTAKDIRRVEIRFGDQGKAYRYLNGFVGAAPPIRNNSYVYAEGVTSANPLVTVDLSEVGKLGEGYVDVPFTAWIVDPNYGTDGEPYTQQLAVGFLERNVARSGKPDGVWNPGTNVDGTGEFIFIFNSEYDPNGNQQVYKGNFPASSVVWADLRGYTIPTDANATDEERTVAESPYFNILYGLGVQQLDSTMNYTAGDKIIIPVQNYPYTEDDVFQFTTKKQGALTTDEEKQLWDKVNVFPNPLFGFNPLTSYDSNGYPDEPFVTFSNLPNDVTVKIYSLSGSLLRTLVKESSTPFLRWDLKNESQLRVASGMYLAIVTSPKFGDKVLKFAIIMPQKQIQRY